MTASHNDLEDVFELEKIIETIPDYIILKICDAWNIQAEKPLSCEVFIKICKENRITRDVLGKEIYEQGCIEQGVRISSKPEKAIKPPAFRSPMRLRKFRRHPEEEWTWIENLLHARLTSKELRQLCCYLEIVAPKGVTAQHAVALFRIPRGNHAGALPRVDIIELTSCLCIIDRSEVAAEINAYQDSRPPECVLQ